MTSASLRSRKSAGSREWHRTRRESPLGSHTLGIPATILAHLFGSVPL